MLRCWKPYSNLRLIIHGVTILVFVNKIRLIFFIKLRGYLNSLSYFTYLKCNDNVEVQKYMAC